MYTIYICICIIIYIYVYTYIWYLSTVQMSQLRPKSIRRLRFKCDAAPMRTSRSYALRPSTARESFAIQPTRLHGNRRNG